MDDFEPVESTPAITDHPPLSPGQRTYRLLMVGSRPAIQCFYCGMTSFHRRDIEHRYCANCDAFHQEDHDPSVPRTRR